MMVMVMLMMMTMIVMGLKHSHRGLKQRTLVAE
jgi:hypothetical protein